MLDREWEMSATAPIQNQLCEDLSGFRMSVNYRVGESRNLTGLYIPTRFECTQIESAEALVASADFLCYTCLPIAR